jgi:dinuclear metal center YbgI/SA1388 family protein
MQFCLQSKQTKGVGVVSAKLIFNCQNKLKTGHKDGQNNLAPAFGRIYLYTMQIREIIQFLDTVAPARYQESYDNSGLLYGDENWACTGIVVALDATIGVIEEAIAKGANLVITHHPILFSAIKKIEGKSYAEQAFLKAIKNDMALLAVHTNLDNVIHGVNGKIAQVIGLQHTAIMQPAGPADTMPGVGSGLIGELASAVSETAFLAQLKAVFKVPVLRHSGFVGKPVKTVAVCGGSGSFLINRALQLKADIYITADMKYHQFFDANGQMVIVDVGHFESEQYTIDLLYDLLAEKFPTFAVFKTGLITNPVNYYS